MPPSFFPSPHLHRENAFLSLPATYPIGKNPLTPPRPLTIKPFVESHWLYSFITQIELLGKIGLHRNDERVIREMLSTCELVQHNDAITETAIRFRKKYKIKLPDAVIAATANYSGIPLLTADKEFAKLKDLDLVLLEL